MLKKTIFSSAFGWTILIAFLCLVKFNDLPTFSVSGIDKYVHFILHFVFTFLWGCYFWLKEGKIRMNKMVFIVTFSFFYGIVIEVLQETCTKTRHADVNDILANSIGALSALLFFLYFEKKNSKI